MTFDEYKVDIPEGQRGNWRIEKFTVSKKEADFQNMRASFSFSDRGQFIIAGEYTRLSCNASVVMSDTPSEISDHLRFIGQANGSILINGLGLGVVVKAILMKDNIEKIIVNELSEDVINLVGKYYADPRLTINHADAFTWNPKGIRFNCIWHDIWTYISEDNLPEMKMLHRRYGHWLQKPFFQDSWGRWDLERRKNHE